MANIDNPGCLSGEDRKGVISKIKETQAELDELTISMKGWDDVDGYVADKTEELNTKIDNLAKLLVGDE